MKRLALVLVSFVILAVSLPKSGIAGERRIPLTEYADKVRAAWLGKMAGVGWGITTEFRYSHRLVPDSMMQPWCVKRVNEGYNQDDLYLSLLSLELLRKYGPEVSARTACIERQNLQFEYGGRNPLVFRDSIAPPDLGHPHYKPTSDGCGYTCGADFSGIVAPGLPAAPVRFAASFGTDRCIIRKTKRCDFPERSVRFCKTKCILGSTPTLLLISQNRPAYAGNVKRRLNTIQTPFALRFVASLPPMLSR